MTCEEHQEYQEHRELLGSIMHVDIICTISRNDPGSCSVASMKII